MDISLKNMCTNEVRKVALLITKASNLGMDVAGYGAADVNSSSGYVYLWLEDYPFTLYIPPSERNTIYALWTDPNNGDEEETPVHGKNLDRLMKWCDSLENRRDQ